MGSQEFQETQDSPAHPDIHLTQGASCLLTWLEGSMRKQETWRCCTDHGVKPEPEDHLGQTAYQGLRDLKEPLVMLATLDQWETLDQEDRRAHLESLERMVRQEHQESQEMLGSQGHLDQEVSRAHLDPQVLKDTEVIKAQVE